MQIGIGAMAFRNLIAKDAGYDAWISLLQVHAFKSLFSGRFIKLLKPLKTLELSSLEGLRIN